MAPCRSASAAFFFSPTPPIPPHPLPLSPQVRRDALGCDALCQGGQTSLRSALTLVGATVVGHASDRLGRIPMLWLGTAGSMLSLALNLGMDSLTGTWVALVPVALFNQNFSVSKVQCHMHTRGVAYSLSSGTHVFAPFLPHATAYRGPAPTSLAGLYPPAVCRRLYSRTESTEAAGLRLNPPPPALRLQALFSDYIDESGGSEADKAGAVGQLGMAVGFSFMVGPMMASLLISEYR